MLLAILDKQQRERLQAQEYLDFSYEGANEKRWRCHYYRQRGGLSAALRAFAPSIPTLEELRLPPQLRRLAHLQRGLVLVTGATGSGKTSTLAAILREINLTHRKRILTIEDPIEFVHEDQLSTIQQRAVGVDVASFQSGVLDALYQDLDVLVVGELRDYETVRAALTAAETGALVFATLHSNDVPQTIDRVLDMFDTKEQPLVRVMLSTSLEAVVSQILVRALDGQSRIPACEIMFRTAASSSLIRAGRIHELRNSLQTGRSAGMCLLDDSLATLVTQRLISREEALRYTRAEQFLGRGRPEWYVGSTDPRVSSPPSPKQRPTDSARS